MVNGETRLASETLQALAAYAATARWPAGFTVYQRDAAADGLFVVLSGQIVLRTRLKGGRAFVPAIATPGELFGMEGMARGATYHTDARAECEAHTLHLGRARLRTLLRERPDLALQLVGQAGRLHAALLDRLRELAALSVEQRLLAAVSRSRLARADVAPDAPITFDAAGYRLLCEMVGATRESVSLVVNRLVAEGLAARDGQSVSIAVPTHFGLGAPDAPGELLLADGGGRESSLAS